jgi:putative aminopeptidase FrvX
MIHGPSGFEGKVAGRMRQELEPYVDQVATDSKGNLIAVMNGEEPSIMVAAHMDQIALYVEYVDENNLVYFQPSGLIDPKALANVPVLILTEEREVPGYKRRLFKSSDRESHGTSGKRKTNPFELRSSSRNAQRCLGNREGSNESSFWPACVTQEIFSFPL